MALDASPEYLPGNAPLCRPDGTAAGETALDGYRPSREDGRPSRGNSALTQAAGKSG
jgi:hypothetical protein